MDISSECEKRLGDASTALHTSPTCLNRRNKKGRRDQTLWRVLTSAYGVPGFAKRRGAQPLVFRGWLPQPSCEPLTLTKVATFSIIRVNPSKGKPESSFLQFNPCAAAFSPPNLSPTVRHFQKPLLRLGRRHRRDRAAGCPWKKSSVQLLSLEKLRGVVWMLRTRDRLVRSSTQLSHSLLALRRSSHPCRMLSDVGGSRE